jgi:hypothetical protein
MHLSREGMTNDSLAPDDAQMRDLILLDVSRLLGVVEGCWKVEWGLIPCKGVEVGMDG